VSLSLVGREHGPHLALALADAGLLLGREHEVRDVDAGQRNRDEILPLAADQLALGHEAPKLLADAAAHDLAKARVVSVNPHRGAPETPAVRTSRPRGR